MIESENILIEGALVYTLIASTAPVIEENNREKIKKKNWVWEFLQQRDKHEAYIITATALKTNPFGDISE